MGRAGLRTQAQSPRPCQRARHGNEHLPALETVTGESLGPHWSASLIESARPEPGRDSVSENMMKSFLRCSLAPTQKHSYTQIHTLVDTKELCLTHQNPPFTVSHVIFTYSGTSSWVGRLSSQIVGRAEHGMAQRTQTGRSIRALASAQGKAWVEGKGQLQDIL